MKMLTLNRSDKAATVATFIGEHFFERHRGAMHDAMQDTDNTFCITLFGNDCYEGDSNPDRQARTKAYVHNLYAGVANLLPEGAVEFGTDKSGYSWAIVAHFPYSDRQETEEEEGVLASFWNDVVWSQWHSQLSFAPQEAGPG